jgi:hypothetical protein
MDTISVRNNFFIGFDFFVASSLPDSAVLMMDEYRRAWLEVGAFLAVCVAQTSYAIPNLLYVEFLVGL